MNTIKFECQCGSFWQVHFEKSKFYDEWYAHIVHGRQSAGVYQIDVEADSWENAGWIVDKIRYLMDVGVWKDTCEYLPANEYPHIKKESW